MDIYDNLYDEYLTEEEIIKARIAKNGITPEAMKITSNHTLKGIDICNKKYEEVKNRFEEYKDHVLKKGEKK